MSDDASSDATVDMVMEICGCTREAAARAVEAAGPGGVELAVDLVLSTQSAHWASANEDALPPLAAMSMSERANLKMVCLVRRDLGFLCGFYAFLAACVAALHGAVARRNLGLRALWGVYVYFQGVRALAFAWRAGLLTPRAFLAARDAPRWPRAGEDRARGAPRLAARAVPAPSGAEILRDAWATPARPKGGIADGCRGSRTTLRGNPSVPHAAR